MRNCDIMQIKKKICKILQRWHNMVSVKKSEKCIFLQKKYDKHKIELPKHMPSSGILGIRISRTSIRSRSDKYDGFKAK